jgi:hypothetical protein
MKAADLNQTGGIRMICEQEIHPNLPRIRVSTDGAEVSIRDAQFPKPFYVGLQYSSPARGMWTIAHSPMLIPGCHEIYVCCACCLQGVVLSAEEIPGGFDRFSMVTVTNENVLKGNLEQMMIDGVADIIDELDPRPSCVECFTSCIQHFLHIDLKIVYRRLRERYPDIDFIDGYMIPTLQRNYTPDQLGRRQLMRAVRKLPERRAVNFIVNYFPVDPDAELLKMFRAGGFEVLDFADCPTYERYREMGASRVNVYFHENSQAAAEDLKKRLGQEPFYAPYSWNMDVIESQLRRAAEAYDLPLPDLQEARGRAEAALRHLAEALGDMPVAIDYTATPRPLSLACLLLTHGIRVYAVYCDAYCAEERENFEFLRENYPELKLRAALHYKMRLLPRTDCAKLGGVLAVGQKAAYFTGTDRFVNIIENGGLHGFSGIVKLARHMEEAAAEPKDVAALIQVKALGCVG